MTGLAGLYYSKIQLIDNPIPSLFSKIEVKIHGKTIAVVEHVARVSTVKGLISYSLDLNGPTINSGFVSNFKGGGTFCAMGNLSQFGLPIFRDYPYPLFNWDMEICFTRNTDDDALLKNYITGTADDALRSIPVSNDTIKRRIDRMGDYMKSQLLIQIKSSNTFAIQLDESTDLTNNAQLMIFVRYQYNLKRNEDLLFCETLSETTKGIHIFKKVNDFFLINELDWSKCVGVCTDGAAAMTGRQHGTGFRAEVDFENFDLINAQSRFTFPLNKILMKKIEEFLQSQKFGQLDEDLSKDEKDVSQESSTKWFAGICAVINDRQVSAAPVRHSNRSVTRLWKMPTANNDATTLHCAVFATT
ncbi:hypothetical protein QTP88_001725 [Uroleucon formosanum]